MWTFYRLSSYKTRLYGIFYKVYAPITGPKIRFSLACPLKIASNVHSPTPELPTKTRPIP
jgi:hypothetical protein